MTAIAVIGARGGMGRLFVARFRAAGFDVREIGRPYGDVERLLGGVDAVMISVPVYATGEAAALAARHVASRAVLFDVGSVKVEPMRAMAGAYRGPVVGTHPLFGPAPGPDDPCRVAVVEGGKWEREAGVVHGLMERIGFAPFWTTAEEHDRAMAYIQGLNFVTTVAYLAARAGEGGIDKFVTPSFKRRLDASRKLVTEDAELFSALFEANPYSQDVVRSYRNFLSVAAGGDVDLLVQRAGKWFLGQEVKKDGI